MQQKTIAEVFFNVALKNKRKKALYYNKEGSYYFLTYEKLSQRIKSFYFSLLNLDIKKNDKLAILSKNCPEWVIFDIATTSLGAINVPIHSTFSPKVIAYILNHCEAKLLVINGEDLLNKVLLIQDELVFLKKIIYIGKYPPDINHVLKIKMINWQEIIEQKENFKNFEIKSKSNDICSIIYTSGTTGMPKGVCLTHDNFLSNVELILKSVSILHKDVFLSFLPLSHILERTAGYYIPLLNGATIAYAEDIKSLAKNLKEVKPTVLVSVPRVLEKFHDAVYDKIKKGPEWKRNLFFYALKQSPDSLVFKILNHLIFSKIRKNLGGNLRFIVSGGASLNVTIAKFFNKVGIFILEGYGLTETSPVISVNKLNKFKFGTVGEPLLGLEVKISKDREILVKGPTVMAGYLNDKESTDSVIDEDGFLHTGDLGFLDSENLLTIIGRKKEMMVTSGGKNIWPDHIEQLLNIDKYISQSMIIANKMKFVSALIVPDWQEIENYIKEKNLILEDRLVMIKNPKINFLIHERIEKINQDLPDYEKIKKFVLLSEEFSEAKDELTPTLKLRRAVIEKNYKKEVDLIYG
jgi:long-chain acyl-CoA synthetase